MPIMPDTIPCTKGSDAVCIPKLKEGACCYTVECTDAPSSPTSTEQLSIDAMNAIGYPTKDGD